MRHRGKYAGHCFVSDQADGAAFTPADDEIMVLFASLPVAANVNAGMLCDVERACADLAALVETAPMSEVVFDGGSVCVASVNREAHRLVKEIGTPGSRTGDLAHGSSDGPPDRDRRSDTGR